MFKMLYSTIISTIGHKNQSSRQPTHNSEHYLPVSQSAIENAKVATHVLILNFRKKTFFKNRSSRFEIRAILIQDILQLDRIFSLTFDSFHIFPRYRPITWLNIELLNF